MQPFEENLLKTQGVSKQRKARLRRMICVMVQRLLMLMAVQRLAG
jgi:hypothetical protein